MLTLARAEAEDFTTEVAVTVTVISLPGAVEGAL